jgi:hypothetical protein
VFRTKGDGPLYQTLLRDSSLFALLEWLDEDLASQAREGGCRCGGVLHSARYPRKPRGGPEESSAQPIRRSSFCCSVDGCRRRLTPPSLRFLGRKVYYGIWVLLLPVLREGPTPERLRRLEEVFAVSRRTLLRWRRWWREALPTTRFWEERRGLWARPIELASLPGALLGAFTGKTDSAERVLAALRWLAPLASSGGSIPARGI